MVRRCLKIATVKLNLPAPCFVTGFLGDAIWVFEIVSSQHDNTTGRI